jgi:hypothetical protein
MPSGAQYILVLPSSFLILLPCFARTKPLICTIHDLLDSKAGIVPPEIQMPRVFSPDAVTVSPAAAPSSRGDRPLGCIGRLKAFLTRRQVNSSPGRAAPPNSSWRGLSDSDKAYTMSL